MSRLTRVLLLTGCLLALTSPWVLSQEENLNFCEITCVINIYKEFCGEAKCTTGASDYPARYALCSDTCISSIIGDVMSRCLTQTSPDRDDWDGIQSSTFQEIISYCNEYNIPLNTDVKPQKIKDVDKSFLKTMFGSSETGKTSKEETKKTTPTTKKSRKTRPGKEETKTSEDEVEKQETEAETQDEEDTKEETKAIATSTVSKSSTSKTAVSKSAGVEEPKEEGSKNNTKKSSTSSSSLEREEQDEEEGSEYFSFTPRKDIGADEAPGSEVSEPLEEADIIEETLETSVEDSKTSKSE